MITIERIDHIGQVVPDLDAQVSILERLLGFQLRERWVDEPEGVRGALLDIPGTAKVRWEVLAPNGPDSPLQQYLDTPGVRPGVHHVAIATPDTAGVAREMLKLGMVNRSREAPWIETTIDPDHADAGLRFRFRGAAETGGCRGDSATVEAARTPAEADAVGVITVDHLCHAYPDRDALAGWYELVLGTQEKWRTPDGEHDDLADLVMDVPGTTMKWEIIQPVGDESFIARFLETRGPSAHHVTFEVADWDAAVAACERFGAPVFDENSGTTDGADWHDGFVHPKFTGGVLVQLFWEAKPGVWVRSDKVPSGS